MSSPTDPSQANEDDAGKTGIFGGWRSENEDPAAEYLRKASEPPTAPYQQAQHTARPVSSSPQPPPPPLYPPGGPHQSQPNPYQPQVYQPQGYQPQGYQPQGYQPQGHQGGQGQPQWGQPQYANTGFAPVPPNDGMAVAALIVAIFSLVGACLYGIGLLGGPVALGLGMAAKRRIKASGGRVGGESLATSGIVIGAILTVLLVALIALVVVGLVAASNAEG